MRLAAISSIKWRRYLSRFTLLLLLCAFAGCSDDGCAAPISLCGKAVNYNEAFTLTGQNSSKRLISPDQACGMSGYVYSVNYGYENFTDGDPSLSKNKPNITVKAGTVEHGVLSSGKAKPVYSAEYKMWTVSEEVRIPQPKKDEDFKPFTLVLTVTMNKPLIQLGSKTPTISLPLIGTIIGPKPKDVKCEASMAYYLPK
jgi:hypothetical protein